MVGTTDPLDQGGRTPRCSGSSKPWDPHVRVVWGKAFPTWCIDPSQSGGWIAGLAPRAEVSMCRSRTGGSIHRLPSGTDRRRHAHAHKSPRRHRIHRSPLAVRIPPSGRTKAKANGCNMCSHTQHTTGKQKHKTKAQNKTQNKNARNKNKEKQLVGDRLSPLNEPQAQDSCADADSFSAAPKQRPTRVPMGREADAMLQCAVYRRRRDRPTSDRVESG